MGNDAVERKTKNCRKASRKFIRIQKNVRIKPLHGDEPDIISAFQVAFEGEIIFTQHCIRNKRRDAYFSKYKLGIKVDEYNYEGKNFEYEQSR